MNAPEKKFVQHVWDYYKRHGRRSLPWRKTKNSYRILVSEVMLQQTQVDRVIPKYKSFLKKFPSLSALASAQLRDVLGEWQGLGYNRRAKMLHECAKTICKNGTGRTPTLPRSYQELTKLPGVGPYTAGAVMAFAYNTPVPIIETNIRTVFIHHFFHDDIDVSDTAILDVVERTLDQNNPREWYYALMDYGAHLKKTVGNQNTRSKHYVRQTPFKNSDRQIRGAILRALIAHEETRQSLHTNLPFEPDRVDAQLEHLCLESFIIKEKSKYRIRE